MSVTLLMMHGAHCRKYGSLLIAVQTHRREGEIPRREKIVPKRLKLKVHLAAS